MSPAPQSYPFVELTRFVRQTDKVKQYMTGFKREPSQPYVLITPATPLAELEEFLREHIFALGPFLVSSTSFFP